MSSALVIAPGVVLRCHKCGARFRLGKPKEFATAIACPQCQGKVRLGLDALSGSHFHGWKLEKIIGRGSMGAVFTATNDRGDRRALKILAPELLQDEEMVARFRREGSLCQRLRHPGLVRVHDHGVHHGLPYLVMDLIEGVSLDRIVDKSGAMDWRKSCELLVQIAEVLAYLQEQEVVHRDIKPENIIVDQRRRATLIDLGFAKDLNEQQQPQSASYQGQLTMAGTALGSPAYMAPEQILDAMSATAATDCYCLGASLYHLVTGVLPYDGASAMEVMQAVLKGTLREPGSLRPQLPAHLNTLICWMMAARVEQRPQSMREVSAIMTRLIADPSDGTGLPRKRASHSGRWLLILGIVVILLVAALAAVFLISR